ncbi:unnamed protein product, partial [Ascophyllum nodosum]
TGWLGAASPPIVRGTVRAVIAPHAGFSYSAQTAAFAYSHMDPAHTATVFILGPSHHVHLRGCAVSTASCLETPIGDLPINQDITNALLATGQFEAMTAGVDEDEHSIEMHLPFVKKVMQGRSCNVVAIMVGALSQRREEQYGRLLVPFLDDPQNFFIVSSDFCHWGLRFRYQPRDPSHGAIHEHIRWLDEKGMALIESQNVEGFARYLTEHANTICGRHPIATFMNAMKASSKRFNIEWVKYDQSSKVVSPQDSSVSYASAVVTQGEA